MKCVNMRCRSSNGKKKYVIERMALEKAIRLTNKHESEIDRKKKEEEEIITDQAENVA